MGDKSEAFVAYYSLWRTTALFLVSLGFVSVCLLGLGVFVENPFQRDPNEVGKALLWIGVIFFALAAVGWGRVFFDDTPAIVVDQRGIYCRDRNGFVPWKAITRLGVHVQVVRTRHGWPVKIKYFVFDVDPAFDEDMPTSGVLARDMNFGYTEHSDALSMTGTNRNIDELLEGVRAFAPKRLSAMLQ